MAEITRFAFGAPVLVVRRNIPSPVATNAGWSLGVGKPSSRRDARVALTEEDWDALALKALKKESA